MDRIQNINFTLVKVISVALVAYLIYVSGLTLINPQIVLAIFLAFCLVLVFLIYPLEGKTGKGPLFIFKRLLNYLFILLGAWSGIYIVANFKEFTYRAGMPTRMDIIMGAITTFLVIDMARRTMGKILPILALFSLAYALWGIYVPQPFTHAGVSIERLFNFMYLSFGAIFSTPTSATARYIALFVFWGTFLEATGATKLLLELAQWFTGQTRGGPAKTAVIASGLMGMISGSGMANVVTTGVFTIPLMKKSGYEPEFAGAVEAAASTGGQIMPPVMGAAAFLIAEVLGIPYSRICLYALIPGLLYFFSIFVSVDVRAAKLGLKPLKSLAEPTLKGEILKRVHLLLSPVALVLLIAVANISIQRAAFWALVIAFLLSLIRKDTRLSFSKIIKTCQAGAKSIITVAAACACSGIILGVISMTGIGLRLSGIIFELGGGNLFFTLVMVMIASLIMGMGLPTTACYIILSVVAAPTLVLMGISKLSAHMFVFYFGILSTITPPIGLAAFAAAGIAGADQMRTAFASLRIAFPAFIIGFLFIYSPSILFQGDWKSITFDTIRCSIIFLLLPSFFEAYLFSKINYIQRGLILLGIVLLLFKGYTTIIIGFSILACVWILQYRRSIAMSKKVNL